MGDLQLRQDVMDELKYEPRVDAAHISAAVDDSIVTLSDHVGSYQEKLVAVSAVQRLKGVRAIADEIEVRYPSDKKTSDEEIAKRATDILGWDTLLPTGAVRVTVRSGWVTLGGDVDWYYQKKSAEEDVRKLSGVRGVINNIVITPRVAAEDIKRKLADALRRYAEIEAKAITITVRGNNEVVLEGSVDNWDERYAVQNAAWSAPGVKAVDDLLTIA